MAHPDGHATSVGVIIASHHSQDLSVHGRETQVLSAWDSPRILYSGGSSGGDGGSDGNSSTSGGRRGMVVDRKSVV